MTVLENGQASDKRKAASGNKTFEKAHPHSGSHIKRIIGVLSGKGGVGKSTVTALFASSMRKLGERVGIIDADITGPSIPKAFRMKRPMLADREGWYPEVSDSGIKIVSVNLMLENESDPVIWRGPLVSKTVKQFYTDVVWGDIDTLFVDFPPGTGDVAITMMQSIPLDGVVVVTSPQDLVSMIVSKAINMTSKMNVPVLGLVENMAYFICPNCHERHHIFGESHIHDIATQYHLDVLAELPMNPEISKLYDSGRIDDVSIETINDAARHLKHNMNGTD